MPAQRDSAVRLVVKMGMIVFVISFSNSAIILHRASGYAPGPAGQVNAGYVDMSVPFSAGALYSTTHDLLRWEEALYGGKVISPAALKKMTTPFKQNYACGLMVQTVNGHTVYEHGGAITALPPK